ncbi:MAG: hypothetical protein M0Q29_06190 [Thiopseudomonas sp.]|nr:hypothetical protein [Thiopseudomonas sp.]MCK9465458.1 hypothetical protein [Thiopseudomonas sp.]
MRKTLVMGLGGAGMNIARHVKDKVGCDILAVNTNAETLANSPFAQRLQIGPSTCQGKAAKSLMRGQLAAEESLEDIKQAIKGANRLILLAGLGGGTATGAGSIIIDLALSMDMEVVLVATLPFEFESAQRATAMQALPNLEKKNIKIILHDHAKALKDGGAGKALTDYYNQASEGIAKDVAELLK